MQRVCRALRVGARAFKENEVPVVAGEEVRRNQEEKFNPQRRFNECFGLSTGLIISWDLFHRCRRQWGLPEAGTQPIFSSVKNIVPPRANQATVVKKASIDASPFLKESLFASDCESQGSVSFVSDDEDDFAFQDELPEKSKLSIPKDLKANDVVERLAGNVLSAVGATKILLGEKGSKKIPEPPISGLELLNSGAELGSSRALYNLGVYYDRQREYDIAQDYYKRAADIGHPIASYNYAAMIMEKNKNLTPEVKSLMSYAYEHGVSEAKPYALQ
ncbi:unnamed protein product [Allacma fusca]|uniref:Uncharacterized protein n=1 Tax=Allacma fusca TaxID=39272 RepID=A0A8J2JKW2_9HEXA|nr:unnamed protein product [Allacma fusca]